MFSRALILLLATLAFADTTQELIDVFGSMASALSEDNPAVFLRAIDPSAPGYAALARNVNALANQNELTCSIEIVKQDASFLWTRRISSRRRMQCGENRIH